MTLLNLADGRVSLEFKHGEWPKIDSALTALAGRETYAVRQEALHDMIVIGAVELIVMDEWDEPCLISMCEPGDRLLRCIAVSLAA